MPPDTPIRAALHDELDTIIAIDDDATRRYATAGLATALPDGHPFLVAEVGRFARALAAGDVLLAEDSAGRAIGVVVLGFVDGAPYLEQLSVRMSEMNRGVGRALLARAIDWANARGGELWLTTYNHIPWNRPFYERTGFTMVPEERWGPELQEVVAAERVSLPDPQERIVMRRR